MSDDLAGFLLGQPVIHRPVQMVGNLRNLTGRDEGADRDEAAVARCEPRPQPEILRRRSGLQLKGDLFGVIGLIVAYKS